jgi:hypothetical protein
MLQRIFPIAAIAYGGEPSRNWKNFASTHEISQNRIKKRFPQNRPYIMQTVININKNNIYPEAGS